MSAMEASWEWLPETALDLILKKLVSLWDFVRFSAVCKRWNSIANENRKKVCVLNESRPQPPFLIIPSSSKGSIFESCSLYSVTLRKTLDFQVQFPFPLECSFASSRGWLFFLDKTDKITVFNPFSNKAIILPPIPVADGEHEYFRLDRNAILSSDPQHDDFEVLVAYHMSCESQSRLGVYKSSEKAWTSLILDKVLWIEDLIYHKGNIHVLDYDIGIIKLLVASDNLYSTGSRTSTSDNLSPLVPVPVIRTLGLTKNKFRNSTTSYLCLVENGDGDLLLIQRICNSNVTRKIKVFKMFDSKPEGLPKLVEIKDIGDNAVFLGWGNDSVMVPTREFPGLQRNCIYFGEDDAGIFNLDDGSIERQSLTLRAASWIIPTLTCHDNINWNHFPLKFCKH